MKSMSRLGMDKLGGGKAPDSKVTNQSSRPDRRNFYYYTTLYWTLLNTTVVTCILLIINLFKRDLKEHQIYFAKELS